MGKTGTPPRQGGMTAEKKLKTYFSKMLVYKSARRSKFFSAMSIPSFMRDWLTMRFSDAQGNISEEQVAQYVHNNIPGKDQWNQYLLDMIHSNRPARFLTKVKIDFDLRKKQALFSLPVFGVPAHKGEAVADWDVVEKNRDYLLSPTEVWGIVDVACAPTPDGKSNIFRLKRFVPFCPYTIDLPYYAKARSCFTTGEWIDVLLSAIDYNPAGYATEQEKLAMLKRLLPFVESRLNLIELAPKETGKSYLFSQISQYGWLVSGGSISRAKMFYDISKKTQGLVSRFDYVALDEIQSIRFTDAMEMQGALKGYLESGNYHVGDYRGVGQAGMMLLGNIPTEQMDDQSDMFSLLPEIFHESALLDRFHGFIKGWEIPKMRENLKAEGWALNSEYFSEVLHLLREESVYRSVVDSLLILPADAATRDTEAIKRLATAFLKLLFPHVRRAEDADAEEFERYCVKPAVEMRSVIKRQLSIIDPGEFGGKTVPVVTVDRRV